MVWGDLKERRQKLFRLEAHISSVYIQKKTPKTASRRLGAVTAHDLHAKMVFVQVSDRRLQQGALQFHLEAFIRRLAMVSCESHDVETTLHGTVGRLQADDGPHGVRDNGNRDR